jgi:chromosome segregation ATPase
VSAYGFFTDSGQIGQLRSEAEGFLTFDFNTSESDLGSHTATIEAEGFSTSKEIGIDVIANQEQRSSVETKLDRFSTELESLRSNYTEVKQKVSGDRESNLTSEFNEYESVVEEARTAVQSDNYADAKETLNSAQSKLEASEKSVSSNKEFVQSRNQRNTLIIGVVAVLVLLTAGVGGFIYSERYEVDIGQAVKSDIPVSSLSGLKDRIKTIFTDEEDADEFEWSGFED